MTTESTGHLIRLHSVEALLSSSVKFVTVINFLDSLDAWAQSESYSRIRYLSIL